ncbi:MAG: MATE family efflux transporter, partial [Myxococcales bacterium]|nr:MATE family efflux transporter [Myxococcales bacterium]
TYLGAESIVGAFGPRAGTPLFELSVLWVRLLGWGMPLAGMHISYVGMLRGAGDTAASLRINTMGTLAVQIPLSVLLGFVLGLGPLGIWVGFPISVGAKALLGHLAYRRNRWAQTGLTFGARAAPR